MAAVFAVDSGVSLVIGSLRDAVVYLVLAPVLEEWVFREGLQRELSRRSQRPHSANLIVSAVFIVFHWQGQGLSLILWVAPALALGEVWRRHESLCINVLLHIWFNLALWLASQ